MFIGVYVVKNKKVYFLHFSSVCMNMVKFFIAI